MSYTVNGGAATLVPMQPIGPEAYGAAIPGQVMGATIDYFVEVTDNQSNTAASVAYRFQIAAGGDETPPDCGNFALTLPAFGGSGGGLLALLLNVLLVGAIIVSARKLAFVLGNGAERRN